MLNSNPLRVVLWTSWIGALVAMTGCAGKDVVLPAEGRPMLEIYRSHLAESGAGALVEARLQLRRPLEEQATDAMSYTRTAANEIEALFVRLPNPDLILYVYPHLATVDDVPVPGYSTVFPMYERVIYALPGEVP